MSPHQLALGFCLLSACSTAHEPPRKNMRAEDVSAAAPTEVGEGVALIEHFECARCHQGVGEVSTIKDCTGCHQEILRGEFDAEPSIVAGWQERLGDTNNALIDTLDLGRVAHFRRDWIASFLKNPVDLRPALGPTMPRLAISEEQANAIAATLVPTEESEDIEGDAEAGEILVAQGRCGRCHLRGGEALPGHELRVDGESSRRAPDLAHVGRWQSGGLLRWLMDPQSMDPETLMPQTGYSQADAQNVAAFLLQPATASSITNEEHIRLPLLKRDVFHDEVEAQVFRRLCWHCHGDPDYARSEGGPGNTGGFGFAPRRLDLSSYEGVMSGAVDEEGHRYSVVFNEGTPRIVEALLARHLEVKSSDYQAIRGMPLGMPPLSFQDIRLVESWIAQGARR